MADAPTPATAAPDRSLPSECAPDIVLALVAGYVLLTASGWPARSALFPSLVATVLLVLVAARVATVVVRRLRAGGTAPGGTSTGDAAGDTAGADTAGDTTGDTGTGGTASGDSDGGAATAGDSVIDLRGHRREVRVLLATLAGYTAALLVLGFVTGTAVASLLTARYAARGTWRTAVGTALALAVLVWGLQELFGLEFRTGLLF